MADLWNLRKTKKSNLVPNDKLMSWAINSPKPPVKQTPQIAPCAAFLPIVLKNTDICAQFSNNCNIVPIIAATAGG
jgi:hypothetical protein